MNLWKAGLSLAAVIGVLLAANDSSAQSLEPIVKTQIHISLTDPDSGQVWHVQRLSRLSWADIKDCERQKAKTGRFDVSAVEGYGLVNAAGKSPVLKLESITCVNTRK